MYEALREAGSFAGAARLLKASTPVVITKYWRHLAQTKAEPLPLPPKGGLVSRVVRLFKRKVDGAAVLNPLALKQRWPDARPGDRVRVEWFTAIGDEGRDTMLLTRLREGDDE